jgi:hypothetical protein
VSDVSIVIVNFNTLELLRACLQSIAVDPSCREFEVIVVDNASTDGSVNMVKESYPHVQVVVNQSNEGFARPNNTGIRMALGRYILLLNSDTEVKPGAIREMMSFLESHPEAGACGPMLLYPDGTLQHSVKGFPTLWTHWCDMFFLDKMFSHTAVFGRGEMAYFDYHRTQAVDHVMASAFLVRREVCERVGLFDERFTIYYNDMDWCYRMVKAGWRIYYVYAAQTTHHMGQTVSKVNRGFAYFEEMHNNVMLFYRKHYGVASVVVYKLLLAIGFIPRSLLWWSRRMLGGSDHATHMSIFCWRTLKLGLRFWVPVPDEMPKEAVAS